MEPEQLQFEISRILKQSIQKELATPVLSKTYDGRVKPVSGLYTYPPMPKDNTGFLSNSVNVYFRNDLDEGGDEVELVVDFGTANYWRYIDQGRIPGEEIIKQKVGANGNTYSIQSFTKFPPLDALRTWVQQRPALQGAGDINTRAYLAGRSIAKYGMFPYRFIDKAFKNAETQILDMFGEYAVAFLFQTLERGLEIRSQIGGTIKIERR